MLFVVTLIAYAPAMRAGWIWDDDYYVTNNMNLRDARGLANIWTKLGLPNGGTPQYYPVTHTTFWLEYQLWGVRPAGYHVVNILLHASCAVMLWIVLKKLEVPGAWLAAAVFALHLVHVESVAWVTERKNVLSGAFYFGALLSYLAWACCPSNRGGEPLAGTAAPRERLGERPKPRRYLYALALLLFIAALLSKSVTASLPAAILLIVWWKQGRIAWRDVKPLVPMFVLGVAMGMLTGWVERTYVIANVPDWEHLSLTQRVLIAGGAVWFYAWKLIWPANLAFIYPRWSVDPREWWQWLFPLAAAGVVVALWALRHRIGRGPLVAVLFFGGTLVPALGFVDVFPMRYSFVADHFQYLASIGLVALIVSVIATRVNARVAGVVLLAVLGILTFRRTFVFQDARALWTNTIEKNPTAWMPRNNLALLLMSENKLDAAEAQLAEALQHHPNQGELLLNMGIVQERNGNLEAAIQLYQQALQRMPQHPGAMQNLGRMHLYLGLADASREDFAAAAAEFRRAVQLDPSSSEAWNNLGAALEKLGNAQAAIEAYERALQVKPDMQKARDNLARLRLVR